MKIKVNGNQHDVEIAGNEVRVDGNSLELKVNEDHVITLKGKQFFLDYFEEGESSFMIINGMSYLVSKTESEGLSIRELRAPIGGEIIKVSVADGDDIAKGQLLFVLEAMKMENQMKSPRSGRVKQVKVKKGELAKRGDILLTFE